MAITLAMAQNIYDDPKFFVGYTTLRRQKIYLDRPGLLLVSARR